MSETPFCIRLFIPNGDPTAVIVASHDMWTGKAVVFPRELLGEVAGRIEFRRPGVYLLAGGGKLYVGEGDPVGERISAHHLNKAFWTRAVFFVSAVDNLNKAHVQRIEAQLITLLTGQGGADLDNKTLPKGPTLGEEDRALADGFLREIRLMLPLLGFHHLVEGVEPEGVDGVDVGPPTGSGRITAAADYSQLPRDKRFFLEHKEASASLKAVEGGVLVLKGSTVVADPRPSFAQGTPYYATLRIQLVDSGVIAEEEGRVVFTDDQFFSSASAAASIVRGLPSNANGWVTDTGDDLGDLLRDIRSQASAPHE
jgi:hypothetical protein